MVTSRPDDGDSNSIAADIEGMGEREGGWAPLLLLRALGCLLECAGVEVMEGSRGCLLRQWLRYCNTAHTLVHHAACLDETSGATGQRDFGDTVPKQAPTAPLSLYGRFACFLYARKPWLLW